MLGILADEKKVDLDKSPRYYLPDLKFYNNDMDNLITIRDMMCHRTGLPRHDASWYYFPSDSKDSLTRRIQFMEPSAGIRQKYQYNNFMFMLQGNIVEKVSGRNWEENVTEKIFKPLGMSRSNFTIDDLKRSGDASLGYGAISIVVKNDSLFAVFPLQTLWLRHYHYDIFQPFDYTKGIIDTTESSEVRINFRTNDQGEIESLLFPAEPVLKPLEFKRQLLVTE